MQKNKESCISIWQLNRFKLQGKIIMIQFEDNVNRNKPTGPVAVITFEIAHRRPLK